jgi:hypothetical protein
MTTHGRRDLVMKSEQEPTYDDNTYEDIYVALLTHFMYVPLQSARGVL